LNGKDVQRLADLLMEWKKNHDTAENLRATIERYIGNSWIEKDKDHNHFDYGVHSSPIHKIAKKEMELTGNNSDLNPKDSWFLKLLWPAAHP